MGIAFFRSNALQGIVELFFQVAEKVGKPQPIVADYGSAIKPRNPRSFTPIFDLIPEIQPLVAHSRGYLTAATLAFAADDSSLAPPPALLATSDVIESIIGKYKLFSAQRPLHDIGSLILTIPLLTTRLSTALLKTAMESVKALDVQHWANDLFGPSTLSKRRSLPSPAFVRHYFCMKKCSEFSLF